MIRQSIQPTYDSSKTGMAYHISSRLNDRTVVFMQPVADPFVTHTVHIGWWDRLRCLLRRRMDVTVLVGGDKDRLDDVLELDDQALIPRSTRHQEFHQGALGCFADQLCTAESADALDDPEASS